MQQQGFGRGMKRKAHIEDSLVDSIGVGAGALWEALRHLAHGGRGPAVRASHALVCNATRGRPRSSVAQEGAYVELLSMSTRV